MKLLKYGSFLCLLVYTTASMANDKPQVIRIAMLHLQLEYANLEHNAALIETGIDLAAEQGADWIMTPELSHTGYRFDLKIGTDWISKGPDQYVKRVQVQAARLKVNIFLSHLERTNSPDQGQGELFNTLFVIDRSGEIIGRHRKINTIPISESWSAEGDIATIVTVDDHQVGLLICADAWPQQHAQALKENGAELILSSASWAPGKYGPGKTWENRSKETNLPIFVNNRTGIEREFDLTQAVSVLSYKGQRLLSHQSPNSQLVILEWDSKNNRLLGHTTKKIIN